MTKMFWVVFCCPAYNDGPNRFKVYTLRPAAEQFVDKMNFTGEYFGTRQMAQDEVDRLRTKHTYQEITK